MKRVLLLPLILAQVSGMWGQTAAPDTGDAEKALRARAEQFYQLQVDRKYRQAEAFVAEDTKDLYFAGQKNDLLGFTIQNIELLENNTKARVTVKAKSTIMVMGTGKLPVEIPSVTLWKIENGNWMWYVDVQAPRETPFGTIQATGAAPPNGPPDLSTMVKMPDMEAFRRQVTIDRTTVALTKAQPAAEVTITNSMPGFVDVSVEKTKFPGFTVAIDQTHVAAAGKAVIRISRTGEDKAEGVVHISVAPLATNFEVRVVSN